RWNPLVADMRFDARNLDVSAVRPYLAARLNAVLTRAELSARGNVTLNQSAGNDAPLAVTYRGNARLANLHMLDVRGESDLLDWQGVQIDQIAARMGQGPPEVSVGKIALSDFYARVIVSSEGRLNLVDLIRRDGATTAPAVPAASPAAGTAAAPATDAPAVLVDREMAQSQPAPSKDGTRTATAPVAAPADTGPRPVIRIGQIEVARGNVYFTDNFIKPNYTANMTDLGGSVSTLASDSVEPATLALSGKTHKEAPLAVNSVLE